MEGERYVQAIAAWDGGRCLFQDFSERSFEMQQVAVEEVLKGGFGKKWYVFYVYRSICSSGIFLCIEDINEAAMSMTVWLAAGRLLILKVHQVRHAQESDRPRH